MQTDKISDSRTQEAKDLIAAGKLDPSDCRNAIFVGSEPVQSETVNTQYLQAENQSVQ